MAKIMIDIPNGKHCRERVRDDWNSWHYELCRFLSWGKCIVFNERSVNGLKCDECREAEAKE